MDISATPLRGDYLTTAAGKDPMTVTLPADLLLLQLMEDWRWSDGALALVWLFLFFTIPFLTRVS